MEPTLSQVLRTQMYPRLEPALSQSQGAWAMRATKEAGSMCLGFLQLWDSVTWKKKEEVGGGGAFSVVIDIECQG